MTRLKELRALLDKAVAAQKALRTNLCYDTCRDNEAAWGKLSNGLIHECAQLVAVAEAADDVSNDGCPCFRCVKIRAALAPLLEEVEK
jgi:hypothetical protein